MFEFWLSSLHTYGNVLFNASYYAEVENGLLLRGVMWSWKMIIWGRGKVVEKFLGKRCGNPVT